MKVKISVVGPVLNEAPWIGYSILAGLPYIHEYIYALDAKSNDGTRELLHHVKDKYAHEKLVILEHPTFRPHDTELYNAAFSRCIAAMTGNAAFFLHPDMIITDGPEEGIEAGPMAWWTEIASYAGDLETVITRGRTNKWKNIHAKKMGLHYFGGYGSANEDFYHSDITGKSYKHFGSEFSKYPYRVENSGIKINHYCENKDYSRRYEKMLLCLRTQHPSMPEEALVAISQRHPRVTLQDGAGFEFKKVETQIPEVIQKYQDEFSSFKTIKEGTYA